MKRRYLFTWFLALLPVSYLAGQRLSEKNFDHYTTVDGMSHNIVNAILQDSTGYIWISTPAGLNRYNGSRFVQFHDTNDSLTLASEALTGLEWLNNNQLAVYTTGMHIVNTKTGESRNLFIPYHNPKYQYKFNMIETSMGDEQENIFVLSRSGFYHFDKKFNLLFRFDYYKDNEVPVTHMFFGRDLLKLDNNRIVIVSIDGLFIYDKARKKIKRMESADCPILSEFINYPKPYYSFYQYKPGQFFILKAESDTIVYVNTAQNRKVVSHLPFNPIKKEIHYRSKMSVVCDTLLYITGHYAGFYKMRFYPADGTVKMYPEKYFRSHVCNSIIRDKDRHLWIATNKGLFREDPAKAQLQVAEIPASIQDSFPLIRLDDIFAGKNKLYAGARGYGGLLIFDKQTLRFEKQVLFNKYEGRGNIVDGILAVAPNAILLATDQPLLLYNEITGREKKILPPEYTDGDWCNDLFRDSKGYIWISARNNYRYNPVTQEFKVIPNPEKLLSEPFVIDEDRSGNIWMAGHGIARFNTMADSFDLMVDSFPFIKMSDKQVNSMAIDHNNKVWFNSNNNGLIAYDIKKKTFKQFTRKDGLPDENIASMMVIGEKLWLACNSGIACMDLHTSEIISFGQEDGFPGVPIVKGARFYYDSAMQQLYIGFSNAVARFNPWILSQRKQAPQLFIESLVINGNKETFLPGNRLTTDWDNNDIMINIGNINFSDGRSQGFAYRIYKDNNSPWKQLGAQPSFSISNLAPGNYTIQVKSFSVNNRWPEQVSEIGLVVLPPFWKKDWFVTLVGIAAVVLMYLLVQWRINMARKKEMEKTHIQKLKAEDYKNQFELEHISNYFSSSLANKKTADEVLWDVASNLIGRMNYVDCMIYTWNEDKTKMIQRAAYGPKGKPEAISAQVFDVLPGQGIVGHVIESRQPVLIRDTRSDNRYRVDEQFRLSEICVPIIHNNELLGIIDSEHNLSNYFTEWDIKILTTIATLIGNKLKQLESEQSLEVKRQELANINEQLAEARLSALQSQMNPHFVFNALNSIKRMILDGDNVKASRYLSKFALMIRMTLNHSRDTFVTLNENIEYLKAYLEMEQLRFEDSFSFNIVTGDNIDVSETTIPSLMIQPLAENAIWHGLMHTTAEKKLHISFTQEQNKITCAVEDNGIGIRQSEKLKKVMRPLHRSVGLENLQKRIKIMNEKYDMDCSLEITDLRETGINGSGTRVVLRFNMINS